MKKSKQENKKEQLNKFSKTRGFLPLIMAGIGAAATIASTVIEKQHKTKLDKET